MYVSDSKDLYTYDLWKREEQKNVMPEKCYEYFYIDEGISFSFRRSYGIFLE